MPKVNQRVAITKRLIKEGLLRLLEKKQINKISVSELCQEAEINRSTFYRHYETPRDVLEEIASDQIGVLFEYATSAESDQNIKGFIEHLCIFLLDRKDIVKIFLRNNMEIDLKRIFQTLSQHFLSSKTILYRGKAADQETLQLLDAFYSAGMYSLISQWITEDIHKTSEQIADLIYCFVGRDITFQ